MLGIVIFFLWVWLSIFIGVFASRRGRDGIGWAVFSLLTSPVCAILTILLVGENKRGVENKRIRSGESKRCPYCAELVKSEAVVCKHCGKDLPIPTSAELEKMKREKAAFEEHNFSEGIVSF